MAQDETHGSRLDIIPIGFQLAAGFEPRISQLAAEHSTTELIGPSCYGGLIV